ncbi:hypothetical protein J1605_015571 [Eschrichtius robustus]|uniref:Uncharacterized protein n=1 Tax=Eschrichtius robustus TaxID=9764 RepID=A0AB34GAQ5_ESCRO|nr:hypothetical protein J1605_015571 [Eschrichtius robustus]
MVLQEPSSGQPKRTARNKVRTVKERKPNVQWPSLGRYRRICSYRCGCPESLKHSMAKRQKQLRIPSCEARQGEAEKMPAYHFYHLPA